MEYKELKNLAEEIAELEIELLRDPSPKRKEEIEREIMFRSENPDLKVTDYFLMDEIIQDFIENRVNK